MGLAIHYRARLSRRDAAPGFLGAARREAGKRGWKVSRGKAGAPRLELIPHERCEPVTFDFTDSLVCEGSVKTSFAPLRTHVQVVEFLRAVEPLLRSLSVEDECEYWETGDREVLKKHRGRFDQAFGRKAVTPRDRPITFVLDAKRVTTRPGGKRRVADGTARIVTVKPQ